MLLLPWLGLHVQAGMKNLRHPQMVLVFFVLVMGQFRPDHFPSKSRDAQDAAPSFWGASTQSTETFVSQDVGKHRLEGFRFAVFGKDMKCSIHDLSG